MHTQSLFPYILYVYLPLSLLNWKGDKVESPSLIHKTNTPPSDLTRRVYSPCTQGTFAFTYFDEIGQTYFLWDAKKSTPVCMTCQLVIFIKMFQWHFRTEKRTIHWTWLRPMVSDPWEQTNKQVAANNQKSHEFQYRSHSTSICHFHFCQNYFFMSSTKCYVYVHKYVKGYNTLPLKRSPIFSVQCYLSNWKTSQPEWYMSDF